MTPSEIKEKIIKIEATITELKLQLSKAEDHKKQLHLLEADMVITRDIETGVHAAAQLNREVGEGLEETSGVVEYPSGDKTAEVQEQVENKDVTDG
tara:strand:- start:155 stop:442 length:288 start_codon:yes stop_codon:yes gene_type:complete